MVIYQERYTKFHENPLEVTVQWEPNSFIRTDGWTDRETDRQNKQTEEKENFPNTNANSRYSKMRKRLKEVVEAYAGVRILAHLLCHCLYFSDLLC